MAFWQADELNSDERGIAEIDFQIIPHFYHDISGGVVFDVSN